MSIDLDMAIGDELLLDSDQWIDYWIGGELLVEDADNTVTLSAPGHHITRNTRQPSHLGLHITHATSSVDAPGRHIVHLPAGTDSPGHHTILRSRSTRHPGHHYIRTTQVSRLLGLYEVLDTIRYTATAPGHSTIQGAREADQPGHHTTHARRSQPLTGHHTVYRPISATLEGRHAVWRLIDSPHPGHHALYTAASAAHAGHYTVHAAHEAPATGRHRVCLPATTTAPGHYMIRGLRLVRDPGHHITHEALFTDHPGHHIVHRPADTRMTGHHIVYLPAADRPTGHHTLFRDIKDQPAGHHRIANDDDAVYKLYRGTDGQPDLDADPWQTADSLPITTPALDPAPEGEERTYHFTLRQQNKYSLESQNIDQWTLTVDDEGKVVEPNPSAPVEVIASSAEGARALIEATYLADQDGSDAATQWAIYLSENDPPDPETESPTLEDLSASDGAARLRYTTPTYTDGTDLHVLVRTKRDDYESTNENIQVVTIDAEGPTAADPDVHLSDAATLKT